MGDNAFRSRGTLFPKFGDARSIDRAGGCIAASFFLCRPLCVTYHGRVEKSAGGQTMTLVRNLNVLAVCVAFGFVAAIVVGVI
ncbi:hypothetical protein [Stappia sp.]|uniref:hypothetical protein n=1 Tax=Stappia sp. TaxID=1870903 RepID=UPI0032D96D62